MRARSHVFAFLVTAMLSVNVAYSKSRDPASSEESNIAFFIQVSPQSMINLPELLYALYHPDNLYLIHLDLKIKQSKIEEIRSDKLFRSANVVFLPRVSLSWGGISLVLNTISAMEAALHFTPEFAALFEPPFEMNTPFRTNWSHFVLMSASDFPLLASHNIRLVLGRHRGTSFLRVRSTGMWQKMYNKTFSGVFQSNYIDPAVYDAGGGIQRGSSKRFQVKVAKSSERYKGEAWVILAANAAKYVVTSSSPRRWLLRLARAFAPDELFFPTVLAEKIKADAGRASGEGSRIRIKQDPMRFIEWTHGQPHPNVIHTGEQYEALSKSGALFTRKVEAGKSAPLLRKIQKKLFASEAYVERVQKRIEAACDVAEPQCREFGPDEDESIANSEL